ncbi:MAG: hypothetical protein ABSG04_06715 [Verrucomicrobiota bacterium]
MQAISTKKGLRLGWLQNHRDGQPRCLEITVQPHPAIAAKCSRCLKPAPGHDRLEERAWLFVPLWGMVTCFLRCHTPPS